MNRPRKFKIYHDEVKDRHTSHWDWDYLSTEEIEALVDEQREREAAARAELHRSTARASVITALLRRVARCLGRHG